jgi:hypothetical protein
MSLFNIFKYSTENIGFYRQVLGSKKNGFQKMNKGELAIFFKLDEKIMCGFQGC